MKYTESQLQAALVRALSERLKGEQQIDGIGIRALARPLLTVFVWKENGAAVTPHEWPAIVGMVEDGLTKQGWEVMDTYLKQLHKISQDPHICGLSHAWEYVTAGWHVRAQALADIGAITVEDKE